MTDKYLTLDPDDWDTFRARAHTMLDASIDKMETAREGRVWNPPNADLLEVFREAMQAQHLPADKVDEALTRLLPYGVGNTHPRFLGWVHGSGTPSGLIAEMVAGAINANCGGRNHAAIEIERMVVDHCRRLFDLPESTSGLIVSGTSMATIIALKVARDRKMDFTTRAAGLRQTKLVGYTSAEAHSSIARAFDFLGLGADALRLVPVNAQFEMDTDILADMIADDRAAGLSPFCVVATAGSVNTGAIDPLTAIADVAKNESLWMHVDGAFGACAITSPSIAPRLSGIEHADSIAFDFHKWMHVNYDAGCVLVRDGAAHRRAFSDRPDYLSEATDGLAANSPWPVEFGPELSRSFRALKVWAQIAEHGFDKIGQLIKQNCDLAQMLATRIDAADTLERLAPVSLQIVCFRVTPAGWPEDQLDALNDRIVIRLQTDGIAAPSTTRINGHRAIRVSLTNHRTTEADLDIMLDYIDTLVAAFATD